MYSNHLPTIDSVLQQVRKQLNLSKETEWELLEEIRAHLEDAVEAAKLKGQDETTALLKAAEAFGVEEVGEALQDVHRLESAEALLMCIVPVFATIVLRWTVFSAEGTARDWQQIVTRPTLLLVAIATLVLPLIPFRNWRYASIGWVFFWTISLVFMAFPSMRVW